MRANYFFSKYITKEGYLVKISFWGDNHWQDGPNELLQQWMNQVPASKFTRGMAELKDLTLLQGSHWPLGQILSKYSKSGEWVNTLVNVPELAMEQPKYQIIKRKKKIGGRVGRCM